MSPRYRSHKIAVRLSEMTNQRKLAKLLCKYHYPELKTSYKLNENALKENMNSWRVKWTSSLQYGICSYRGNHIKLYFNNALFYDFWRAVDESSKHIILESYTIGNDETALKTIEKLESASQRGVSVRVVYDFIGSSGVHERFKTNHQEYKDMNSMNIPFNDEKEFPIYDIYYLDETKVGLPNGPTETLPLPEQKVSFQARKIIQFKIFNHIYNLIPFFSNVQQRYFHDLFNRNHSKRAFVDGDAFIGGNNIENKYSHHFGDSNPKIKHQNPFPRKRKKFRDFHSRVRGEITKYIRQPLISYFYHRNESDMMKEVRQGPYFREERQERLQVVYNDVKRAMKRRNQWLNANPDLDHQKYRPNGNFMQIYQSTPHSLSANHAVESLLRIIEGSKESIFITTPYLMLPSRIKSLLISKAQSGVDVRIITCGKSDIGWFPIAAKYGYQSLVASGIRIYEYYDPQDLILHAKSIVVDRIISSVGSMNMDYTSLFDNRESILFVTSPSIASKMVAQFFVDLRHSNPITPHYFERQSFYFRTASHFLYWLYKTGMHYRSDFRKRA